MKVSTLDRGLSLFEAHERMVGYAERTIERRLSTVRLFTAWQTVNVNVNVNGRDAVEGFLASRATLQTRASYLGDLRRFYGWAVDRGHVESDPTIGVTMPRVPAGDARPLESSQVAAVLAACRDRDDRLVIGLGLYAGLRVSEMAALRPSDVRWAERVIVVAGKGRKVRRVPVSPVLAPDLEGAVICRANTRDGVSGRIGRVYARAGVVGATPHSLRHTFATELAIRSNGNLQLVAELLGHASLNTTRRYCRWMPGGFDIVARLYDDAEPDRAA